MQAPIPLIQYDDKTSKFSLNEDAARKILALPSPLGVISIVGLARTGIKSFKYQGKVSL